MGIFNVAPLANYAFTVGHGGAGGVLNEKGDSGGNTLFSGWLTAGGGSGGDFATNAASPGEGNLFHTSVGGAGGSFSGSVLIGYDGVVGERSPHSAHGTGGFGGASGGGQIGGWGGTGGSDGYTPPYNGTAPGGGGGGVGGHSQISGGNGAPGRLIVWW